MTTTTRTSPSAAFGAAAFLIGAVVAVALGAYGAAHEPTGETVTTLGFGSMLSMKVWLALAAGVLALGQLTGALWMYGRLGRSAPPWLGTAHRIGGLVVVVLTVPVAFHCLWSLGFASTDTRVLVHSILGCIVYGALITKVLLLHGPATKGWTLPVAGGLLFTAVVLVVLTSSVWYLTEIGVPDSSG